MLPSELLRTKTSRGKITPLFCKTDFGNGTCYELANKIIMYFLDGQKNKQSKGDLLRRINSLESEYDYKLVRGLYTLLERRTVFGKISSHTTIATPFLVRQKLFEESSSQGLALSDLQRQKILEQVGRQLHVQPNEIETLMWSDKDENLILQHFDTINPKDLILWYNLSLMQTLLFKCTKMEFCVKGGIHWKHVLRNVKRFGLMYTLEYNPNVKNNSNGHNNDKNSDDSIICALEGPLSLFKMTDRYGTSMAKLLPSIVGTPVWRISGSIVKKIDNGQKIHLFELSNKDTKDFLRQRIEDVNDKNLANDADYVYDSSIEADFAKRFNQHFDQSDNIGWKISREPNPLIADGKAMIPDFLFERFGHKVYLEIVGFWTKEYLERKTAKIKILFDDSSNKDDTRQNIDLLVAINADLSCSSQVESIFKDRIFTFKKKVSIKPVLEHLKKIDEQIVTEKTSNTQIVLDENDMEIISIKEIAKQNNTPKDAAVKIVLANYPEKFIVVGSYLISKEKITTIKEKLEETYRFVNACDVMTSQKIPDSCHADLLSSIGYDVIWQDLDPNHARISKK